MNVRNVNYEDPSKVEIKKCMITVVGEKKI